jgi:hypothetical protein
MLRRAYVTVGLLTVLAAGVSSQSVQPTDSPSRATPKVLVKAGQALINGTAVDTNAIPLSHAAVRLRNLADNRVEQVGTADHMGQFRFVVRPEVPYVVEIADRTGRVVAVSDVITAHAGDVAAAVITSASRLPATAGIFSNSTSAVLSALTTVGIAVIDPEPPLSPEK